MQAISGVDGFYTQTNSPENAVVAAGEADRTIVHRDTVKTGGKGQATVPALDFPTVDSSGSVNLTPDERLLFVVNAGDYMISLCDQVRTEARGPRRVRRHSPD